MAHERPKGILRPLESGVPFKEPSIQESPRQNVGDIAPKKRSDKPVGILRPSQQSLDEERAQASKYDAPEYIAARTGARLGTTAAGVLTNIPAAVTNLTHLGSKGVNWLAKNAPEALGGGKETPITPSWEQIKEKYFPNIPVTSNELYDYLNEKSGGALTPRSSVEKFAHDVVEETGNFVLPGSGAVKNLARAAKLGLGVAGTGKVLEQAGFGEGAQGLGKFGASLLPLFSNVFGFRGTLTKAKDAFYNTANSLINPGDAVRAKPILENVQNALHALNEGVLTEPKRKALSALKHLYKNTPRQEIQPENLAKAARHAKEIYREAVATKSPYIRQAKKVRDTFAKAQAEAKKRASKIEFPEALPGPLMDPADTLSINLNNIEEGLRRRKPTEETNKLLNFIDTTKKDIKHYEMPLTSAIEAKKNLNEIQSNLDPSSRGFESINKARKSINKSIAEFGQKNKGFYENFAKAEELHGALEESEKLSKLFQKPNVFTKFLNAADTPQAKALLYIIGGAYGFKKTIGAAIGANVMQEIIGLSQVIKRSPHAKAAFEKLLENAAKQDVRGALTAFKTLSKETAD